LPAATRLTAGGTHTCAAVAGTTYCWGEGSSGQIGTGSASQVLVPTAIALGTADPLILDAGSAQTCAIDNAGVAACWGSNTNGQLGDGTTAQSNAAVSVAGLAGTKLIAAGSAHGCGSTFEGFMYCWGENASGQLGENSSTDSFAPLPVYDVSAPTAVTAGLAHTCVILASGQAQCWGTRSSGQVGDGVTGTSIRIRTNVSGMTTASRISAGNNHTCALVVAATVHCWGTNGLRQLGDGTTVGSSNVPTTVTGLSSVIAVDSGGNHTCAIVTGGQAKCWGGNASGQIGNGNTTSPITAATNVTGVNNATAISTGGSHSCAIVGTGSVKCWGQGANGQLGNGASASSSTAVNVSGITNATAIEVGDFHSCAIVALGAVKCWGAAGFGRLGNGDSATDRNTPVDVSGLIGAVKIAAGGSHTCATLGSGKAYCWGKAADGALGNGLNSPDRTTPYETDLIDPLLNIAIGDGAVLETDQPSIGFSVIDSPLHNPTECNLDGGGWNGCNTPFTPSGPLSLGDHSLGVRTNKLIDGAPLATTYINFSVSVLMPSVQIDSPYNGQYVADATPAIGFTVDGTNPLSVECQIDGGGYAACASPFITPTLSNGSHTIDVRATDPNTNVATSSVTFTVDTVNPVLTMTTPTASMVTADSTPAVGFSIGDSSPTTAECSVDAGAYFSCASPFDLATLADGNHTVNARAFDQAGNTSATVSRTFRVDTAAPTVSVSAPANGSGTNDTTPAVSFTVSDASTYTTSCSVDGGAYSACASGASLVALGEGAHSVSVQATDVVNNVGTGSASFTIDVTPPNTSITGNPANPTDLTSANFTFSASETSTFECRIDGAAYASCTTPRNYAGLTAASHTFDVRATDTAGNVDATPASYTWTVDTNPPDTTIVTGPAAASNVPSTTASFTFSSAEAVTYECKLDAAAYATCPTPHVISALSQGSHTLLVRAVDLATNVDATPASRTWSVDTIDPSVTISAPSNGGWVTTTTPAITFGVADASTTTTQCSVDSGSFTACTTGFVTSALSQGAHDVQVRATDAAGNQGSSTVNFTIDTVNPTVVINSPASGATSGSSTPTVAFTVTEANAAATQCRVDGGSWVTCGPTSYTLPAQTNASHTVEVRSTDQVGRTGTASVTFTVDTTFPTVTVLTPVTASVTNDTTPTLDFIANGTATPLTIDCSFDGSGVWVTCADTQPLPAMTEGVHDLTVRVTDNLARQTTAYVSNIRIDTTNPAVTISAPAAGTTTNDSTPSVTFGVTDATSTVLTCSVDAGAFGPCGSPFTTASLSDGAHSVNVRATDAAGNIGQSSVGLTVDTAAPVLSISSPTTGATIASLSPSINFAATDATATSYSCSIDGGGFAPCVSPFSPSLAAGAHSVDVRATDAAGNQQLQSVAFTLTTPVTPAPLSPTPAPPSPTPPSEPVQHKSLLIAKQTKLKLKLLVKLTPPIGSPATCAGAVSFAGKLKGKAVKVSAPLKQQSGICIAAATAKLKKGMRGKLKLTISYGGTPQIASFKMIKSIKIK
ncbi:MAG: Ig-like domain-containing protein, partial [Solirubrobacterales bacterium]